MKKYGIIVFNKTKNIGDDIQSYAALKRLPKVDYFIERERLNEFISTDKSTVKTIMNGWFLHNRISFPPSKYIDPLYVSCHFSSLNDGFGITTEYIEDYVSDYMKIYQPIGCRDKSTEKMLKESNINSYLSYCLTLTIPKFEDVKRKNEILLVDTPSDITNKVKEEKDSTTIVKEITHELDVKKNFKLSYEKRMENVEKLLKKYQGAKFVVTTRLHCALPCLALGTPVLLIFDDESDDILNRIGDYRKLLNYCSRKEFLEKNLDEVIAQKARTEHLEIAKKLEETVAEFIESPTRKNIFEYDLIKNNHHMNKLLEVHEEHAREFTEKYWKQNKDLINMTYAKEYWEKEYKDLMEKYQMELNKNNNTRKFKITFKRRKKGEIDENSK